MKIGIIVAMSKELALLKPLLEKPKVVEIDGFQFHEGAMGNKEVVAMQCGIGKVNAAIGTVTLINNFMPDLIINTGVAGGADKKVNVMDIVVGENVSYHDVWCGPESTLGAIQGLPLYYKGNEQALSVIPDEEGIKRGLIASGDQFIDTVERLNGVKKVHPNALAIDMESGAIAQVCEIRKVPFLSMRVISDSPGAGHNNTQQYKNFWEDAPTHTFEVVHRMLLKL